jgi:serine protease Do
MKKLVVAAVVALFVGMLITPLSGQSREEKVRSDRQRVEAGGFWIYNDLKAGFARAAETGKPLLVVLRCIPCEECVKLDDSLLENDPAIQRLLQQFVCVRQISTNGLDLSLFQFDTDQSWAVFMLNADGTIYGRYGTRSHRSEWNDDVSLSGLAEALRGALELHSRWPDSKDALAGKRGQPMEAASPELYPALAGKYTDSLNETGKIVPSCIHCHQIGDAQREFYWSRNERIPEEVLFPFPHPKSIGLQLDPATRANILGVENGSWTDSAGLETGDRIETMSSQPILSLADVQWVLHNIPAEGGKVALGVARGEQKIEIELQLPAGWRRNGDLSWRSSSWGLRRMVTGGLVLKALENDLRKTQNLEPGKMALRVDHVGQYNEHAAAKRAGFQLNDVLIEVDGRRDLMTEADLFFHVVSNHRIGDEIPVVVRRGTEELRLKLPVQH